MIQILVNTTRYTNKKGDTNYLHGLRVRITFTLNTAGVMAVTFITITGISEHKLPKSTCLSGCLVILVVSLCPSGTADPRNKLSGFIRFVCTAKYGVSESTSEQKNFEWYRENVLLPFISVCCSSYFNHIEGTAIPDELTTFYLCGGGQYQLRAITIDLNQERETQ